MNVLLTSVGRRAYMVNDPQFPSYAGENRISRSKVSCDTIKIVSQTKLIVKEPV